MEETLVVTKQGSLNLFNLHPPFLCFWFAPFGSLYLLCFCHYFYLAFDRIQTPDLPICSPRPGSFQTPIMTFVSFCNQWYFFAFFSIKHNSVMKLHYTLSPFFMLNYWFGLSWHTHFLNAIYRALRNQQCRSFVTGSIRSWFYFFARPILI